MACWSYSLAYGVESDKYKMNNSEYPNIPQAAIDAAYRLMDRVAADRKKREEREHMERVRADAIAHVKPFFDDLLVEIKRVRGELPPEDQNKNEQ